MGLKVHSLLKEKLGEQQAKAYLENLEYSKKLFDSVRLNLRAGMSEIDVKKIMDEALVDNDGKKIAYNYILAAGKNATKNGIVHESDYIIQKGDVMRIDLWFGYNGFWVDTCRNFFVSDIRKETEKMWHTTEDVLRLLETTVRPGMRACDVWKLMADAYQQAGYGGYTLSSHAGHRIGESYSLVPPDCKEGIEEPIATDVAFACEPGIVSENVCLRLEDDYLLTDDGLINVFNYPWDINYFLVD